MRRRINPPLYRPPLKTVIFSWKTVVFLSVLIGCWIGLSFGIGFLFGDIIGIELVLVISFAVSMSLSLLTLHIIKRIEKRKALVVAAKIGKMLINDRKKTALNE